MSKWQNKATSLTVNVSTQKVCAIYLYSQGGAAILPPPLLLIERLSKTMGYSSYFYLIIDPDMAIRQCPIQTP